jgi:hypothetical protein
MQLTLDEECIINISSLLAQKGVRGTAVYGATKAGVLGRSLVYSIYTSPLPCSERIHACVLITYFALVRPHPVPGP